MKIRGGASLLQPGLGLVNGTWPFGHMEISEDDVRIRLRVLGFESAWERPWTEVSAIGQSVGSFFFLDDCGVPAVFAPGPGAISKLKEELEARGFVLRQVRFPRMLMYKAPAELLATFTE